jgi:hypothetical protein
MQTQFVATTTDSTMLNIIAKKSFTATNIAFVSHFQIQTYKKFIFILSTQFKNQLKIIYTHTQFYVGVSTCSETNPIIHKMYVQISFVTDLNSDIVR